MTQFERRIFKAIEIGWVGAFCLVLVSALWAGRSAGAVPKAFRADVRQDDECAKLLAKIKAVEDEIVSINARRPPFDKMDQEEINSNISYRLREINTLKSRRFALGCPGAERVVQGDAAAGGGTGGGAGDPPATLESAGLSLQEYSRTIPGADYAPGDPAQCQLPGEGPVLSVGTPANQRFGPAALADREFTSEVQVNGVQARAGSIGEDMQGYWGAAVSWSLNGMVYTVEVTVPYPDVKDDTPVKRQELYDQCLAKAIAAAGPFERAMRKRMK